MKDFLLLFDDWIVMFVLLYIFILVNVEKDKLLNKVRNKLDFVNFMLFF